MADVQEFNKGNFDADVLQATEPVLVDFWAPWCGPCRMVGPVVEAVGKRFAGKAKVGKVNVDDEPELAGKYGIRSIPSLILFKAGEPVNRLVGAQSEDELAKMITAALD